LALNLSSYPNLKGTFFLDKVFRVEDDFIGMVKSGSTMYSYHNTNRFSKVRLKDESNGDIYLLCNDGGLNTIPFVRNVTISNDYIFSLQAQAQFNSSYYSPTMTYGFRGRQRNPSNTGWEGWNVVTQDWQFGIIPSNGSLTIQSYAFSSDRKRVEFQIQPFATNEEGTYYGESVYIFPKAKPVTFYNDPTTYYIDTDEVQHDTKVYSDDEMVIQYFTPLNLYLDQYRYWVYDYDVAANTFLVLSYIDNTPIPNTQPPKLVYTAYSEISEADAAQQVIYNYNYYNGILWYNPATNIWWANWTESEGFFDVPADGWYANGDISGVNQLIYIVDGVPQ
jgi:hypothetical protein